VLLHGLKPHLLDLNQRRWVLPLTRWATCAIRQRTQQQQGEDTFHGHSFLGRQAATAEHFDLGTANQNFLFLTSITAPIVNVMERKAMNSADRLNEKTLTHIGHRFAIGSMT
jgi:hypothetical protein